MRKKTKEGTIWP